METRVLILQTIRTAARDSSVEISIQTRNQQVGISAFGHFIVFSKNVSCLNSDNNIDDEIQLRREIISLQHVLTLFGKHDVVITHLDDIQFGISQRQLLLETKKV